MEPASEKKNKFTALGFTLGFHALLFLLLIFIVFITPIPPFEIKPVPEIEIGLGMEGMGTDPGGSGDHDPDMATTEELAVTPAVANDAPNIVTDPAETAVSVKTNPDSKTDAKADAKVTEEEKASQELLNALAKLKNKKGGKGEGAGDKGGSGDGTGKGVGGGDDDGKGNRPGIGQGQGGYDLKGRSLMKKPDRLTDATDEGIVVVEIIVDENGKVIKATPGQRGSSTSSSALYAKARQVAYGLKFNPSPEGIQEQRGTYTFVFTLE